MRCALTNQTTVALRQKPLARGANNLPMLALRQKPEAGSPGPEIVGLFAALETPKCAQD